MTLSMRRAIMNFQCIKSNNVLIKIKMSAVICICYTYRQHLNSLFVGIYLLHIVYSMQKLQSVDQLQHLQKH